MILRLLEVLRTFRNNLKTNNLINTCSSDDDADDEKRLLFIKYVIKITTKLYV